VEPVVSAVEAALDCVALGPVFLEDAEQGRDENVDDSSAKLIKMSERSHWLDNINHNTVWLITCTVLHRREEGRRGTSSWPGVHKGSTRRPAGG
jgi:hypothetical protein